MGADEVKNTTSPQSLYICPWCLPVEPLTEINSETVTQECRHQIPQRPAGDTGNTRTRKLSIIVICLC